MSCNQNGAGEKTSENGDSCVNTPSGNDIVGLNSGSGEGISDLKNLSSKNLQQSEQQEEEAKVDNVDIRVDQVQEGDHVHDTKVDQVQEVEIDQQVKLDSENVKENDKNKNADVSKRENEIENDSCRISGRETEAEVEVETTQEKTESNETIFRRPKRKNSNRVYRTRRSDGNSSPDEEEQVY